MSTRKGQKSTADGGRSLVTSPPPSMVPTVQATPVAVQTRAAKRKSNILPVHSKENTTQPALKRMKNMPAVSKPGKSTSGRRRPAPVPTITTPAKNLARIQESNLTKTRGPITQPIEKRNKSRRGKAPIIHQSDSEVSADEQNLNVSHTRSAAEKEDQEDDDMDTGGGDEDIEVMDERQDDLDAGRQLQNEAPRFTITNTVNAGIRTTSKSKLHNPSLSFDDNSTLTKNLEFEFSPLARTTPVQFFPSFKMS
ncbi:hypothetical protein C8R41DRAFT_926591 [Lentinula lateritia]|uniref:Uncharacterized protein n=1 Tax=Lentinula lateritia TaxID=40482 RepID=A0ABQ8UZL2_9AGAR|nr:hypothetical protein C8R41DRAFT_926591 [Lentinula lateritia]